MQRLKRILSLAAFLGLVAVTMAFTQSEFDTIKADQTFRDGVVKFNEAQYGEAAFLFQETLATRPFDRLAQAWLGRAYFHAGFEEASLTEWDVLARQGGLTPALNSFVEYLRSRQGMGVAMNEDQAFFPVHELQIRNPVPQFRRPSSVLPLPEGRTLIASFGTNAIAVMDANGRVVQTFRGGFNRLQGPFDMVLVDGQRLFVSQFLSNQIFEMNLRGDVVQKFGTRGIGPGQMLGPQYMTLDDDEFLYVTDIGNRSVHKFQLDGTPIIDFGQKTEDFDGLERPTGILYDDGTVYVLDARRNLLPRLVLFDTSGNYMDSIEDERLARAEGITEFSPGVFVISSGNSILYFTTMDQRLTQAHESDRPRTRYTKSSLDANGNLVASDFDGEVVEILTRLAGIYSGLHVQIQRVFASRFPEIRVEIQVTDNTGRPIVGLEQGNFVLSEGLEKISNFRLVSAGHRETQVEAMLVLDGGFAMSDPINQEALRNAIRDLYAELGSTTRIGLVSAGANPVLEAPLGTSQKALTETLALAPADMDWSFDRGLRLAVPELIKAPGLKHVIFLSTGTLPETAFSAFGIQETLAYLRNNTIRFSVLNLGRDLIDPALEYLQRESGGFYYELYQATGLAGLKRELQSAKDGTYAFTYRSAFDSDFGRKYLPIEMEVRLFQKSGRDESGYFAPLRF